MRMKYSERRKQKGKTANRFEISTCLLKYAFFLRRAWKGRIATDDNLIRMIINIISRCWCCEEYNYETMKHLFLIAPIAIQLWKHFIDFVGITMDGAQLAHIISIWWYREVPIKLQQICRTRPAIIIWILWKRKNKRKHEEDPSLQRMIH